MQNGNKYAMYYLLEAFVDTGNPKLVDSPKAKEILNKCSNSSILNRYGKILRDKNSDNRFQKYLDKSMFKDSKE